MTDPQITYRGIPHSPAMDARIRELTTKLEDSHPKITFCHVVVDELDRHRTKGNLFEVRIDLHVPGREIFASHTDQDAYVAINLAFDTAHRQVQDEVRMKRGEVKHHQNGEQPGEPTS